MDLPQCSKKPVQPCPAGAADQELFIKEFEELPRRKFVALHSVEDNLQTVKFSLENVNLTWEKRIDAMQTFRSILIDLSDVNLIVNYLKELENSFQISLKDLRSKVVREACITIAFTSVRLQNRCEKFIEGLLPLLFNLTQNSAKIMSSSAGVAIRFIIQHTHSGKFIPIIQQNLASKSKEIRRFCCDFLNQLLRTWSKAILEKHTPMLLDCIKRGLNDADPEARLFSRKAFWMFDYHFKDKANQLFQTLDANKRRLLENEKTADVTSSSSADCLDGARSNAIKPRIPIQKRFFRPKNPATASANTPVRAASSIDIEAMRRAKARNDELLTPVQFTINNSNSSIKENLNVENTRTPIEQQLKKSSIPSSIPKGKMLTVSSITNTNSSTRSQARTSTLNRITRSQPGSRSTSPSLRSAYLNDLSPYSSDLSSCSSKAKRSAIPIITTRQATLGDQSDCMNASLMGRSFSSRCSNQMLTPARDHSLNGSRKIFTLPDYQSDQSEVSSLCSDKSFGDRKLDDINDIIKSLGSTHWPHKKDGLVSLEHFIFHSPTALDEDQVRILTDIFTKMLLDPNTKALSLLLNVLNSFIIHYHNELNFWLYILLTRLFLKTGSDLLSSIQHRIIKAFETISDSFPKQTQFNVILQFLTDTKLTLVLKVKITALQYLLNLLLQMDPSDLNGKNKKDYEEFLKKVITWTDDKKSAQLKSLSQDIISELFNLNTPEFCNVVSQLPAGYWETAYKYMKERKVSKKPVEDSVMFSQSFYDQMLRCSFTKNEDLNQTAFFDSLIKTTQEINKFTSDLQNDDEDSCKENKSRLMNSSSANGDPHELTAIELENYLDDDQSTYKTGEIDSRPPQKTSSMDSGISQIDCASTTYKTSTSTNDSASNKLSPENRENNSSGSDLTTYNSFKSMNSLYVTTATSMKNDSTAADEQLMSAVTIASDGEEMTEINNNQYEKCLSSLDELSLSGRKANGASSRAESRRFDKTRFEQIMQQIESESDAEAKLQSLEELDALILTDAFKRDLRPYTPKLIQLFIGQIDAKELILRQLTIKTFSDLINALGDAITDRQLEQTLDKLLFLTKQDYKDLNSAIQHCTDVIATNFSIRSCVDYLVRIVDGAQYPSNEASIKLLTKFIKHSDEETVNKIVPQIMPCIVRSNDNAITSVRKFSIFCLVELFKKVGVVIKPYLSSLDSSKIKLLKIYIDDSKTARSSSPLLDK